ncbi:MAG: hypothetical protein A4E19_09610 [Nitrospira sp. SG-bin1]|nr:MAG: hypothetical protein A4E19_09610 [Nitrospira sp. SG-bin1]
MDSYRPISDYVLGRITGVAEGYQQLLRRVDTLRGGFEGITVIIRTRVEPPSDRIPRQIDEETSSSYDERMRAFRFLQWPLAVN